MKKPNILFVMPDEFRQSAMGFLKQDLVITPNIDKLASEGLVLNNAVSSYPVCSPYRGQLLTGQYPWSNGLIGNCNTSTAQFGVYLHPNKRCLTDILSENGYECGYIGKWHLDTPEPSDLPYIAPMRDDGKIWDAYTPRHRRHNINFWYSYGCHDDHFNPHYWYNDDPVENVRQINEWSPKHEADIAIKYIENKDNSMRDPEKPFILFWSPNPPHMPFDQVPEKYKEMYKNKTSEELLVRPNALISDAPEEIPEGQFKKAETFRRLARENVLNYFAAVTGVDDQLGRILDALDRCGLKDDTIVIFTSDHGEMMGSHLLMYKGLWYDECFKVPFIIRYPGKIKPGTKDFFLNPADIMPTLLEMLGLSDQIPENVEGESKAKCIFTDYVPEIDEGYYINPQVDARGVQNRKYYFVAVRDKHDNETHILYDLEKDPYQMKNIAKEMPHVVKEMRQRLEDWLVRTKDLWVRS
ncbi:MAG: sulfatase-like hydrolase/transferase [Clostridiales bacterium]|jgi:arylsulfatase A-like enzyme|nr:sulfatase-like hydrolase/transferase [Clostridiales bacterium]